MHDSHENGNASTRDQLDLQTLGQEFKTIVNKKPLRVLHALLLSGFDSRYKLMDSYIKAIQLDTAEVRVLLDRQLLF